MRPLVSIAAFALFLTVPLCAQRGGGHAGGFGGARGMSGAHMAGGHFSGGMRSGFSGSAHTSTSSANGFRGNRGGQFNVRRPGNQFSNCFGAFCGHPGLDSSSWGGINYNVRRRGNQFSNCFGAFCGHDNFRSRWGRNRGNWGWGWGWSYYDPWLWSSWDYDDYRFDRDYYRERALAQQWNEQQLEESRMREEEAQPDHDENSYHRRSYSRNAQPVNDDQKSQTTQSSGKIFWISRRSITKRFRSRIWTYPRPQKPTTIGVSPSVFPALRKVSSTSLGNSHSPHPTPVRCIQQCIGPTGVFFQPRA